MGNPVVKRMVFMEQRFLEQNRTVSKQYGPKVEAVLSGVFIAAVTALLVVSSIV